MKKTALLFGINYVKTPRSSLRGCINDVHAMKEWLDRQGFDTSRCYDDVSTPTETTGHGIVQRLYEVASETWRIPTSVVWVHYSGHGTRMRSDGDDYEADGYDECIVPSDMNLIRDDTIRKILTCFHPKTKVVLMFDCCHSGTIADLRHSYRNGRDTQNHQVDRRMDIRNVVAISGCMDSQTSADAFNVRLRGEFTGAMTSCFLQTVESEPRTLLDAFDLVSKMRTLLRTKGFSQYPVLSSSKPLGVSNKKLLP